MVARKRGNAAKAGEEAEPCAGEAPAPDSGVRTESNGLVALHRSRCWDWTPAAVVAMAACPVEPLLAVGYETGDVELWDLGLMARIQRVPGGNVEVTALAWARDSLDGSWRTFCACLNGTLTEVDWRRTQMVAPTESGAGAIWSLSAQPVSSVRPGFAHPLAAGCDDGSVRLFVVEAGEGGAHYERTLARLQGRVLAVAWHPSGLALVAGGADGCIHALDAATGIETMRITVALSTSSPVCVWRLLVLPGDCIVSGDSEGAVQFWDSRFGTLLHRFTQLRADVLALATSPDGSTVFASGVDAQVVQYKRTAAGGAAAVGAGSSGAIVPAAAAPHAAPGAGQAAVGPAWVYTHYKRPHTHDVRALAVVGWPELQNSQQQQQEAMLVSGGMDAQLIAYPAASFLAQHPARLTKCPQPPCCQLACSAPTPHLAVSPSTLSIAHRPTPAPLLLCAQHNTLDLWQLGQAALPASLAPSAAAASGQGCAGTPSGLRPQPAANGGDPVQPGREGDLVELVQRPRHLASIRCGAGRLASATVSPDGAFVACLAGPQPVLRLYAVQHPTVLGGGGQLGGWGAARVSRVRLPPGLAQVTACCLTRTHLVVAHADGGMTALLLPGAAGGASTASGPSEGQERCQGALAGAQGRSAQVVAGLPSQQQQQGEIGGRRVGGLGVLRGGPGSSTGEGGGWQAYTPLISHLCASSDGTLVAAAGARGVSIARLELSISPSPPAATSPPGTPQTLFGWTGKLLRSNHDAPATSLAFSPDAQQLAVTLASGQLEVYDVAGRQPTPWSLEQAEGVAACLQRLPGVPMGCSWDPSPQASLSSTGPTPSLNSLTQGVGGAGEAGRVGASAAAKEAARAGGRLLVFSPGGFCSLDVGRPLDAVLAQAGVKRSRKAGAGPVPASLGGAAGPLLDTVPGRRVVAMQHQQQSVSGSNGRVILLADACAFVGHCASGQVLVLEKAWEEVLGGLTAPLFRQRFGN
ncbi:hypothetical protein V8C86DRAFT_2533190 [Haematococcus lacustris]